MKSVFKPLLIASLLAAVGFAAVAQGREQGGMRHGQGGPAKLQQMRAKHQDELKAKLMLAPNQESAWASFTAAMQPSVALRAARPDRAAMDKLTTPERIDLMKSLRATRDAQMNQRADASKAFYATLAPAQKQVFDAEHRGRGGRHGGGHHGMQPKG
jgi:periplasmic protein CpxP/Spy